MRAPTLRALGFHSGWGRGLEALPAEAATAAAGRIVIPLGRPLLDPQRFRRATRDCLWAVAAVATMLEDARASREAIAGDRTALVYVTAAAYGPSNRAFIERAGAVYFPYTAPAAAPAEVAIEYGIKGPLEIFIGGAVTTLRAIWHAGALLEAEACDRVLVLAVEIFEECADMYERARLVGAGPLVEAAACLWLEKGDSGSLTLDSTPGTTAEAPALRRGLGETFACEPLAAVGRRRGMGGDVDLTLEARWCGERARLTWSARAGGGASDPANRDGAMMRPGTVSA
jgi:hypothetical protein